MNPLADASAWERWGPIGLVAFLAISALGWWVRMSLKEASDRRASLEKERDAAQAALQAQGEALHARVVALVQAASAAAEARNKELEERYAALWERYITAKDTAATKLAEQTSAAHAMTASINATLAAATPYLQQLAAYAAARAAKGRTT